MEDRKQDLLGRLGDLSEEAIQKLAEAPGADKVAKAFKSLAARIDELQRRSTGYEDLDKRLKTLEKKLAAMAKAEKKTSTAAKSTAGKKS
jgi:hypothetical protein